ncbi:MAG: hypothetical protein NTV49_06260 [Kiritimatiellaeota bacterium]|nr:hypothetical protein [Kiritimatiellota bacterium]
MFSSKIAALLVLTVVLFFVVLVGLQTAELLSYSNEPSVWIASR